MLSEAEMRISGSRIRDMKQYNLITKFFLACAMDTRWLDKNEWKLNNAEKARSGR